MTSRNYLSFGCDPHTLALVTCALALVLGACTGELGDTGELGTSRAALGGPTKCTRSPFRISFDVNGDRFADMAVMSDTAGVAVYYGGPRGYDHTPDVILPPPNPAGGFMNEAAPAGDVNGDGYDDLIAGDNAAEEAYLYFGGPRGVAETPDQTLAGPPGALAFGWAAGTARDVNCDGYDDVYVSAIATTRVNTQDGEVYVYLGGPSGVSTTPAQALRGSGERLANFGYEVIATYLDADNRADLVISEDRDFFFGGPEFGRVFVFLGAGSGVSPTPSRTLVCPRGPFNGFGHSLASLGDADGDGLGDFVVGAYAVGGNTGEAYVYRGRAIDGVTSAPDFVLVPPRGHSGFFFGWDLTAGGDLDGDGFDDVVVGETDAGPSFEGEAQVFTGWVFSRRVVRPPVTVSPAFTLRGTHTGLAFFGNGVSLVGDANGDGSDELVVGAPDTGSAEGTAYVFTRGRRRFDPPVLMTTLPSPFGDGANFGTRVLQ
jgi:hypothetical protein